MTKSVSSSLELPSGLGGLPQEAGIQSGPTPSHCFATSTFTSPSSDKQAPSPHSGIEVVAFPVSSVPSPAERVGKRVSWSATRNLMGVEVAQLFSASAASVPAPATSDEPFGAHSEREVSWRMRSPDVPHDGLAQLRHQAESGDAEAQSAIGMVHTHGRGVPQDVVQGAFWLHRAAEQGHAQAQLNLAKLFAQGLGVPKDEVQAAAWYRRAAEAGEAEAQYHMALICREQGSPFFDPTQSLRWLQSAATQQHVDALCLLASCYQQGDGVAPDGEQAQLYYQQAAALGHPKAQYQLGLCLDEQKEYAHALH